MRKEIGIALLLGSVIGIVLAIAITTTAKGPATTENKPSQTTNKDTSLTSKQQFTILRPEVNQPVSPSTTVLGIIPQNGEFLIIKTGNTQTLTKLTGNEFSADLTLTSGPTPIEFIAVKKDNSVERLRRTFIVTSTASDTDRFVQGTITDIAEQTLQIRTSIGDVSQAVVSDTTTYKSFLKTPKDLKFSDVAIGDLVATIGKLSEKGILTTRELFVLPAQATEENGSVDVGTISDVSKKQIVVQMKDTNKTYEISSHAIRLVNPDGAIARGTSTVLKKDVRIIVTDTTFFVIQS